MLEWVPMLGNIIGYTALGIGIFSTVLGGFCIFRARKRAGLYV